MMKDNQNKRQSGIILVVDDEPAMRMALREVLTRAGWQVETAECGEAALDILRGNDTVRLMITDYRMGGMTGLELLASARALRPALRSIMMTAYGTIEDAVRAMKEGAGDYLLKPFSLDDVLAAVDRVLAASETETVEKEEKITENNVNRNSDRQEFVASSAALKSILALADEIADADATVLLTGESGTGKEVVARYIHRRSGRRGPFVALNCAALPEGLLESELFGHEKGAFTGAILSRKGRFEQAAGGTLLLDEISEMPLALQAKLLRVLQEKEIVPVGGNDPIKLDVRIIATTNRQLERAIADGQFRHDLYYRLNVIALPIPPLRERPEDIIPLAEYFIEKYRRPNRPAPRLAPETQSWLRENAWPGNVRELENMIERACLLARGESVGIADLQLNFTMPAPMKETTEAGARIVSMDDSEPETLEEMERRLILRTLERTGGNRTRTADLLGVSVRTIRNKLNQYGLCAVEGQ
ncbi:sigma-54 dependent transcriptional regulator [bacterium]|nr:sigma-54 dependent transcriptional regulator [bacterium]